MEISIPEEQGDVHGKISSSMLLRAVQGVVVVVVVILIFSVLVANPQNNFTRWPIPLVVC